MRMNFTPRNGLSRHWLAVTVLVATTALISACASDPTPAQTAATQITQYLSTAYQPAHNEVSGWDTTWQFDKQSVGIAWLAPTSHEPLPLIIYLPGLGESARAGELWRKSWAEAGYAVLSIQGHTYDRSVYATDDAQDGDFRGMAGQRYSSVALHDRLTTVQNVLNEVRTRIAKDDPQLGQIDWNRVVIAGFDLGAQTAAALAGVLPPGVASGVSVQPKAVVLLSPYVDADAVPQTFAHMTAPVLSITGPRDEDPFNWVSSYRQRELLGESVIVPGSNQLELAKATHKTLSGSNLFGMHNGHKPSADNSDASTQGGGHHGPGGGGMTGGMEGGNGMGGGGGHSGGRGQGKGTHSAGGGHDASGDEPPQDPKQIAAVEAISRAFLDSQVKHVPAASQWLKTDASTWLGDGGSLK